MRQRRTARSDYTAIAMHDQHDILLFVVQDICQGLPDRLYVFVGRLQGRIGANTWQLHANARVSFSAEKVCRRLEVFNSVPLEKGADDIVSLLMNNNKIQVVLERTAP